jgi:hypothetical protein
MLESQSLLAKFAVPSYIAEALFEGSDGSFGAVIRTNHHQPY